LDFGCLGDPSLCRFVHKENSNATNFKTRIVIQNNFVPKGQTVSHRGYKANASRNRTGWLTKHVVEGRMKGKGR
jgi:hypothetical protein